jgi:hypothetical protein
MSKAKRASKHKQLGKYKAVPKKTAAKTEIKRRQRIAELNEIIPSEIRLQLNRDAKRFTWNIFVQRAIVWLNRHSSISAFQWFEKPSTQAFYKTMNNGRTRTVTLKN